MRAFCALPRDRYVPRTRFLSLHVSPLPSHANGVFQADTNELFTAPGNAGQYVTFGTPISSVGFTMTFSVQAANDVHLAFMATAASRSLNAYEIVIGM